MKKLLLLSCLLALGSLGYAKEVAPVVEEEVVIIEEEPVMPYGHLYFKIGTEIDGKYVFDRGELKVPDFDMDNDDQGVEFAIEGTKYITPDFEMGLGVAFQGHGDGEKVVAGEKVGGNYESIPLYVVAKYNFPVDWPVTPYVKANLGYSFNTDAEYWTEGEKGSAEIDDGMYYGIGLGMEIHHFFAEVMYQVTQADAEANGENPDVDYERTTFGIGYKF